MTSKRLIALAVAAFAALGAIAAAAPSAGAASAAALPTSTSWPTPRAGVALTYPALKAAAKPSLLLTLDGGRTWRHLDPPPVSFPADQDQPQVAWGDGVIAVTDGNRVVVSRTMGEHWSTEHLADITSTGGTGLYVSNLAVTQGRIVATVTQQKSAGSSTALYSGGAFGPSLSPVPGVSVTGADTYGNISTQGGLQVALGTDTTSARYWYLRGLTTFASAPGPCPASYVAMPGGVRDGKPVVLCSQASSNVAPGETLARVYTAPRLGGQFGAVGQQSQVPNPSGFAAASPAAMTLAASPGLGATSNAGESWSSVVNEPEGSFWNGLAFPSPTVGVAAATTLDQAGDPVGYVYRTTDAGQHWTALTLP